MIRDPVWKNSDPGSDIKVPEAELGIPIDGEAELMVENPTDVAA
jgi:hypothetical protein